MGSLVHGPFDCWAALCTRCYSGITSMEFSLSYSSSFRFVLILKGTCLVRKLLCLLLEEAHIVEVLLPGEFDSPTVQSRAASAIASNAA
ncbi:hypothetical protein HZ326_28812, partial [Fusarium oxysporum f. sp. albedinis]